MRKFSRGAVIFVTLGAFLLTLGLSLKFYAYPRLAVVPKDQNTEQIIQDDNATFFDADNVATGTGPITTTVRVIGEPTLAEEAAEELKKDVGVFTKGQATDNNDEPPPMDFSEQTFAIDLNTGEALPWSGAEQNGEPMTFEGQVIKFPFLTQKKDYQYWDGTVRAPMDMEFIGEEQLRGTKDSITTYRYEGYIPETEFATREVPRGLFGLKDTGPVDARRTYENNRTLWIEPETGVMMKVQEVQKQMLYWDEPGAEPVVAMDTTSEFSPETIQGNIDEYKSKSAALKVVRGTGPIVLGILGILSIIVGVALSIRFSSRSKTEENEHQRETVDA